MDWIDACFYELILNSCELSDKRAFAYINYIVNLIVSIGGCDIGK